MKNIFKIVALLLIIVSFSSCLKDNSVKLDPDKGVNVIEFSNPSDIVASGTPHPLYSFSYAATSTPSIPITISYSGPQATAPQDIIVKFAVGDVSNINEYNTATSNSFVLLNPAGYTLPVTEVVIKAGTSKATFNVMLKPSAFDFSKSEVLPLTIKSVSFGTISGNFNTILLSVSAKNKYDGTYSVTGTMVDIINPALTHINDALGSDGPVHYQLRTVSATKCAVYDADVFGGFYALISNGGALSNYGGFSAIFEFDPATDKVIGVTNRAGQPNPANTRGGRLDPSGANARVSATVFNVKYNLTQPSVVPAAPNVRTTFDEVWTRIGDR
ncbi:DUF1735 domain-containing protein [Pedobacter changchengzhani]|uniref:DUF1735 domain-containing protein n=1 Tax=Pedobacter changchengzhani TaxID=2529274 RepID=A0A4R5MQL2_9SPHI|nr:DUF1735 domain-containing protein [Pedobacter changchengzhani]TDG37539.1 DUF1735 domain-containing protein [Pedobacter changchengzhani]